MGTGRGVVFATVPQPVAQMATTRTGISLAAARDWGGGSTDAKQLSGVGETVSSGAPTSVSHRQPIEDIRQFLGEGEGLSRFAMQL